MTEHSGKTPISVKQAMELTGFARSKLDSLIRRGEIMAYKPGKGNSKVFLCKEELLDYIFGSPKNTGGAGE